MTEIYDLYRLYGTELSLITAALVLLLLLWVALLQWRLVTLRRRYLKAMSGVEGVDLEKWLAQQTTILNDHAERLLTLEAQGRAIGERMLDHAGRVGIVRFNPFQDTGSDQSFSIAWVDEDMNGVVLSSLHTRNGTRVYAKPVVKGNSEYTLSVEEQEAIKHALAGQPGREKSVQRG